jgi:hypothetical protein
MSRSRSCASWLGLSETVALLLAPSDAAAELVELGQPEAVRPLHHHHRRIGHVDAHLHHGRRDEDGEAAIVEVAHGAVLLGAGHATMQQPHAGRQVRPDLRRQPLELLDGGAGGQRLRLLDERTDDERLPALGHLLPHEPVGVVSLVGHRP